MTDFGSHWIATKGKPFEFNGHEIHQSLKLSLAKSSMIEVAMRPRKSDLRMGCIIYVRDGTGEIAGYKGEQFVLWHDSAPPLVEVVMRVMKGKVATVFVHNVWGFSGIDSVHSFTGNSGLTIDEKANNSYTLHCSSGPGDPDSKELEIDVSIRDL